MLVVVVLVSVTFVVDTGAESPELVPFDDTVSIGLTLESERELSDDVELPRVQAFYSQYEYVVGYYGVETFVDAQQQDGHEQRFGYPLGVYVTDYGDTGVTLNDEGYPTTDRSPTWVEASDAWYVVGSDARTPSSVTIVPFTERTAAETFADTHGGEVQSWESVVTSSFEHDDATTVRDRVDEQHSEADELVTSMSEHDDRPVSVIIGEDADAIPRNSDETVENVTVVDSIQRGVDEAPENTTVLVSEGTYDETVEIDRPITLAGEERTTIRGDENGSVVTITEPDVGIRQLDITGVGPKYSGAEEVPGESTDDWDDDFQTYYTGADAGISAHVADGISIADVQIETPSNGIILRESPDGVVKNVTIAGNEDWSEGYAGVMAFRSPGVVQDSTVTDGRDSIYLYRSEGMSVRNNEIEGSLLGIHLMHNDGALLADNTLRDIQDTGIYIMTGPEQNALVGNEVFRADTGAYVGGTESYVAENVFEENNVGLEMEADGSIYEHNVFAGNELGANEGAMLPTNRVTGNDFVGNDEHAAVGPGPLRVWTHDGTGNYWQGGVSIADGEPPYRPYSPTDPVDTRLHTTDGAETIARAPALDALAGIQDAVPGMQTESIVDLSPSCGPNNSDLIDQTGYADEAWSCNGTNGTNS
ncbi:NosD domain-containing protein [Natrialbaceae archaeon A-arb3/5]